MKEKRFLSSLLRGMEEGAVAIEVDGWVEVDAWDEEVEDWVDDFEARLSFFCAALNMSHTSPSIHC